MKATELLHNLGQSLWLDNITRDLLNTGTLKRYIDELSVTGLTSNPTIFDNAIKNSTAYDASIREKLAKGKSGEELFFEVALEDLTRAADLFRPIYDRTDTVDGWYLWKFRRCWLTTQRAPWRRPGICMPAPEDRTCSSRFPARRKACPPSKRRSLPAFLSTSPSCFLVSTT